MIKRRILHSEALRDRLDCFGHYNLHDTICLKWCQLNIRCAIARDQHKKQEILEEFFETVAETTRVQ